MIAPQRLFSDQITATGFLKTLTINLQFIVLVKAMFSAVLKRPDQKTVSTTTRDLRLLKEAKVPEEVTGMLRTCRETPAAMPGAEKHHHHASSWLLSSFFSFNERSGGPEAVSTELWQQIHNEFTQTLGGGSRDTWLMGGGGALVCSWYYRGVKVNVSSRLACLTDFFLSCFYNFSGVVWVFLSQ